MLEVESEYCIGIEDSYSGIKAINSANMISIGIGEKSVLKECDYIVAVSYTHLYNIIFNINSYEQFNKYNRFINNDDCIKSYINYSRTYYCAISSYIIKNHC